MRARILRAVSTAGLALSGLIAMPACAQRDAGVTRTTARDAAARGRYDEAGSQFASLVRNDSATTADRRAYLRLLLETGRVDRALEIGQRLVSLDSALHTVFGEVLLALGRGTEAEQRFQRAIDADGDEAALARVRLGILRTERGEWDNARILFVAAVNRVNRSRIPTAHDQLAAGLAYQYLGREDPSLFKDALAAFDRAIALDSSFHAARVYLGSLFLEKYNGPDAAATFREVLAVNPRHPGALLGMARHAYFDGGDSAGQFARMAIESNPRFPEAHTFLAKLHLDAERVDEAMTEAGKALAMNSEHLPALAMQAAAQYVGSDTIGFNATRVHALELNGRNADFFADLAEAAGRVRLYREARTFAAEAVRLDPRSWRSLALLGTNELRLGSMEEGRRDLEAAFRGDPYNVWTKNTLDLLDQLLTWEARSVPGGRFTVVIDSSRAGLLDHYIRPLAEEAFDALRARYQYTPPIPIRLEVYESHADFSVRTIGLAGLGALGVSFGSVLAMDSPFARERGDFNWGSTLWHEIAHAFTLGMTDHRVPRWFSEGLSVLEERRARPAWGQRASPDFVSVLKADRLLPVSRLNDGFIRPTYPGQIGHAYYEASLVCEFIEERWGMQAILAMLRGYRDRKMGDAIVTEVLNLSPEALDREFDRWLRRRFETELKSVSAAPRPALGTPPRAGRRVETTAVNPGDYTALLRAGHELYRQNDLDGAERTFRQAIPLFPDYAGPGNPYSGLARIHRDRGEVGDAIAMLAEVTQRSETAYDDNLLEAELRSESGDTLGAAKALERTLYIRPGDLELHARLAGYEARLGRFDGAVRERLSVLAIGPVDRADAEYQLALAHRAAGDLTAARRAVLRALEIAPNFAEAQDLLLALRTTTPGGGGEP